MRILYLDSDHMLARNVIRAFRRAGHEVRWHVDPQTAVNDADEQAPDLVILDLLLASRTGMEFLYEFRSYPEWWQVPAILFSSVPAQEVNACQESMRQLNITDYFYKPATSLGQLTSAAARLSSANV